MKDFIPYEQALALKELGFDEPCFGYYNIDPQLKAPAFNMVKPFEHEWCLPAPLKQQAFRWFREKHGLHFPIMMQDSIWYFERFSTKGFKTYEEAEQACLDKLIEICKNK